MHKHIPQLLNERISQYQNRTVFKFKNKETKLYESISWNELKSLTDKVASALMHLGCKKEDRVGIFSFNRPEWAITDLGVLSFGGIVVPMYATASKQDVQYIINETEIQFLFVGNNEQIEKAKWLLVECKTLKQIIVFEGEYPLNDKRYLHWNDFLKLSENTDEKDLIAATNTIESEDLATIIYTSGTTGEPKGAMLTHKNFIKALQINYERLNIDETDVSLCFLPLSHVFERTWLFFLIHCGATNVFLEDPKKVIDEMPVVKPTTMCTVPRFYEKTYDGIQAEKNKWPKFKQNIFNWSIAIGHQAIEYKKDSKKTPFLLGLKYSIADKLVLSKLRQVFGNNIKALPCAGAAIESNLLRFFHATGIFINYGYGATETTATVSCFRTDKYNFNYCGSIMPDVEVNITKENEILVKGETVFKGYYNKPEETAKVLKDGWYHTGDEGEVIDNEYVLMKDRIKDLIKTSGGKYVSPQKLELLIGQDEYIDQIVIIGDRRKFISALIVPAFDKMDKLANVLKIENKEIHSLVNNPLVNDFIQKRLDVLQEELTPYERVIRFTLLPETFSIGNNMLTNTLKIRRKEITKIYSELIEKMYLPA